MGFESRYALNTGENLRKLCLCLRLFGLLLQNATDWVAYREQKCITHSLQAVSPRSRRWQSLCLVRTTSPFTDGSLLAVDPPGRRGDEALSCLFQKGINSRTGGFSSHDLFSSHWGLGFNMWILRGHSDSVYNFSLPCSATGSSDGPCGPGVISLDLSVGPSWLSPKLPFHLTTPSPNVAW